MINEVFSKALKWLCDQFADYNLITMAIVPLLVSGVVSMLGFYAIRRSGDISALILRANSLNDRAQMKKVPHKARKDQLMSMIGSPSMLIDKTNILAKLDGIIDGTTQILYQLHDKRKLRKLKRISTEMIGLEIEYGKIEIGNYPTQ